MKKRSIILVVLVSVLVGLMAPSVAAYQTQTAPTPAIMQATECEEDLSGQTITFYHFGDLSATYSFITLPLVAGLDDALAYFNENGGLCGAEITVEFRDTANDTDRAQQYWDEFSAREGDDRPRMLLLYNSTDGELLRDQAAEQEIPIILAAGSEKAFYGENSDEPGWVFGVVPLYTDQLGLLCEYIGANWDQFGIEGDPVIGHLSWLGAFGQASDTENTRAYCEQQGVGYAGAEYFLPTTSSVAEELTVLLDNGANIIYTTSLATGPVLVAKAIAGAGLQGELLLAGTNWALDTSVIGLGGADVAGTTGVLPYIWWDNVDHPGIQLVLNSWLTNRLAPAGDDPEAQQSALATRNIAYILAYASVDLWIEIMTQTINRVGFENADGAAVYETLNSGFEYDVLQGVLPIKFDAELRAQTTGAIGQIQFVENAAGGVTPQVNPISDVMETPDLRASVTVD